jgi:hypothetical protein
MSNWLLRAGEAGAQWDLGRATIGHEGVNE